MAMEIRQIIFDDQDVVRAIQRFQASRGARLPPGHVSKVTIAPDGQEARLGMTSDRGDASTIAVTGNELAAAMLMFCKNQKIPLPIKSGKLLIKAYGRLTMMVCLGVPDVLLQSIRVTLTDPDKVAPRPVAAQA